ncbi:MAG: hypothetical protein KAS72_08995 [Phycisphaerales bacterium]|nr:hypothetical protein [Phycisphaerales bacterium]
MSASRIGIVALGCVVAFTNTVGADAIAPMDPAARMAALRAELDDARAGLEHERRTEQTSLLVDEATRDAVNRSFYLNNSCAVTHIPGKGVKFSDESGENTMRLGFYTQFRYTLNLQADNDTNPAGNVDGTSSGFEFRRTRIYLIGTMKRDIDYCILTDFGPTGMLTVLDANFTHHLNGTWSITAGQFPLPLLNELTIPVALQQVTELTSTLGVLGPGRTQGVNLNYDSEDLRFIASLNDGTGGINTDWNSDASEIALTARGEVRLAGEWDQFLDFTSNRESGTGAVLGAAVHYQDGDVGDGATATSFGATPGAPAPNILLWTIDGQFEWPGANLYAVVTGRHMDPEVAGVADTDDFTYLLQGGYYLTDDTELFSRLEYIDLDAVSDDPLIVTIGVNKYFAGHANKITVDGGIATENIPLAIASDRVALEVDAAGEKNQFFLRAQWQLVF